VLDWLQCAGAGVLPYSDLAILSEQKSAKIIRLLEEFRRDSPEIHDRVDPEAEAMAQPANPQSMIQAIKESDGGSAAD
jgi:uncharacterized membrane protein